MSSDNVVGFSEHFRDVEVRFLTAPNGQPVVVAADAVEALKGNRTNTSAIVKKYVREKWVIDMPNPNGGKALKCLFEPGLYQLAVNPMFQTEFALTFQDWVFEEVLPKLRAEGGYIMPNATQQQLEALGKQVEEERRLKQIAEGRADVAERKIEHYNSIYGTTLKDFYRTLKAVFKSKFTAKDEHFRSIAVDYIYDYIYASGCSEAWQLELGNKTLSEYYYPIDATIAGTRQYIINFCPKLLRDYDKHFEYALETMAA